jgi:hypothetical protein
MRRPLMASAHRVRSYDVLAQILGFSQIFPKNLGNFICFGGAIGSAIDLLEKS